MSDQFYEGLNSLFEDSFPKKCSMCGKVYHTSEQFFAETEAPAVSNKSLKSSEEEDGEIIVEAFRNCSCGSTLMDVFNNRRDTSEKGLKRREKFDQVLSKLVSKGLDRDQAKAELLKYIKTGDSQFIDKHLKSI
jgi:hypothetical protein